MAHGCKVDRVVDRYDLSDPRYDTVDEGLLARWTGAAGRDPMGYRSLAEWFNERLLKCVYDEHGRDTLGARVDHDYAALTGDDNLVRAEVEESLAADGIDAASLRDAMVSYGSIRTHLLDCLDGEKDTDAGDSDWERRSIGMADEFAREKVERACSALASKGDLDGFDAASVAVQFQLRCDHCPTRVSLDVALDRGYVCADHRDTADEVMES